MHGNGCGGGMAACRGGSGGVINEKAGVARVMHKCSGTRLQSFRRLVLHQAIGAVEHHESQKSSIQGWRSK